MMVPSPTLGSTKLLDLRKAQGLTQVQMAERLGVSQSCLSDWELGRKRPGLKLGTHIAKATKGKVPVASWFQPAPAKPADESPAPEAA